MNVFKHLDSLEKDDGLYNLYVHPRTGQFQGASPIQDIAFERTLLVVCVCCNSHSAVFLCATCSQRREQGRK